MEFKSIATRLSENAYPGRGIIIGRTPDGSKAVTAYFIMGRSTNSRNRVFVEDGEGIRTEAFDPSLMEDNSTPRISGMLHIESGNFNYAMSILKSNNGNEAAATVIPLPMKHRWQERQDSSIPI